MTTTKFKYMIPFLALFLIGANGKSCSSSPRPTAVQAIIDKCGDGEGCYVSIVNKCTYPIYIFYSQGSTQDQPINADNKIMPGATKSYFPLSTYTGEKPAARIYATAGSNSNCATNPASCIIGSRGTNTLFEFSKSMVGSPSQLAISYDISAVDGFNFPMSVQISNLSSCVTDAMWPVGQQCTPQPQFCGNLHTGLLNVTQCTTYQSLNYGATASCSGIGTNCVRWAEYQDDSGNNASTYLDCLSPNPSSGVVGCSSQKQFGANFQRSYVTSPSCPDLAWLISPTYTQTYVSQTWACAGLPEPNTFCWANPRPTHDYYPQTSLPQTLVALPSTQTENAVNTTYYLWVKTNTFLGYQNLASPTTPLYGGVFGFPQDDGFGSLQPYDYGQPALIQNQCGNNAFTDILQFELIIGNSGVSDYSAATGNCPPCPTCQ